MRIYISSQCQRSADYECARIAKAMKRTGANPAGPVPLPTYLGEHRRLIVLLHNDAEQAVDEMRKMMTSQSVQIRIAS
jgi:ribosomal protein S10